MILFALGAAAITAPSGRLAAQAPAFSINPGKLEVEVKPGTQKTVSFEISAEAAMTPEHGRINITATDWNILEDGSLTFKDAGTEERSAAAWIHFSPSALTLEASRTQLVRITVSVPDKTAPGVYRTGLFIQERPPATPPDPLLRIINVRVRFAFVLYVLVPPVSSQAELVNVDADTSSGGLRLLCEMKNAGARHARPLIYWTIRRNAADAQEQKGRIDATVLLPFATLKEAFDMRRLNLPAGNYQADVVVDFQDGKPQQSISRDFQIVESVNPKPATGN